MLNIINDVIMTSSSVGIYLCILQKGHIVDLILHAWDQIWAKNAPPTAKRVSFELSSSTQKKWKRYIVIEISRDKDKRFYSVQSEKWRKRECLYWSFRVISGLEKLTNYW